jgi:hypothetical protein
MFKGVTDVFWMTWFLNVLPVFKLSHKASRFANMDDRAVVGSAQVASSFQLADRAAHNYVHMRQWEGFEKSLANPWTLECPDGV